MSYGFENGNDFSDRVESRSRSLVVIGIHHHIGRIHIIEHDLIGCEQDCHGSDVGIAILVQFDPREHAIPR